MNKKLMLFLQIALGVSGVFLVYHLYDEHPKEVVDWFNHSRVLIINLVSIVAIVVLTIVAYNLYHRNIFGKKGNVASFHKESNEGALEGVVVDPLYASSVPLKPVTYSGIPESAPVGKTFVGSIAINHADEKVTLKVILTQIFIHQPGGIFTIVLILACLHWIKRSPILSPQDLNMIEGCMAVFGLGGALVLFNASSEKGDAVKPIAFGFLILIFATLWNFV